MKHILILSLVTLMTILLVIFPEISSSAVRQALKLCSESIIPSLFPFLILSNIWVGLGYAKRISDRTESLTRKLFHLPAEATSALLLGCLSGFPVGAKTATGLYTEGRLSKQDTEQLLLFCSNAGPAFIFGVLGNGVFHDLRISAALWSIHIISAICMGVLFRPRQCASLSSTALNKDASPLYASTIAHAVSSAGNTIIQICVFIIAFSVIIGFLEAALPSHFYHSPSAAVLIGILELSKATALLSFLPKEEAFILSAALLAWNGLCIHFQVLSLTAKAGLHLHKYFLGKVLHVILSIALACVVVPCLPLEVSYVSTRPKNILPTSLILFTLLTAVIVKTSSGKECRLRI